MEWVQFVLMLKDFHARLAVQDAEFKQHMMCLHDKNKKR